ncbi:MAG: MOSC domain-containing protein [Hyphomicrobiales bacterium]|nr:MOSC domain-containing protein [Hyphomicrobiales bacterium]
MIGAVIAVARNPHHTFSKRADMFIRLRAGLGVEGDAHRGETVRHRFQAAKTPAAANLRQVHLIHNELFAELAAKGFRINPGDLGENITTAGLDLLGQPRGTRLQIGDSAQVGGGAIVELTGLRNPCVQMDRFRPGLMQAVLDRDAAGNLVRKAGVMAIVIADGQIAPGDAIHVQLPDGPRYPLEPV